MLLSGGWTLAAARQPHGNDAVRDTISALAARGATDPLGDDRSAGRVGACHVITATGLRPARGAGRMVLAFGGVATVLVAAFPEPSQGGSEAYTVAASLAFTSLAIWPAFAVRRVPGAPLLTNSDRLRRRHGVHGAADDDLAEAERSLDHHPTPVPDRSAENITPERVASAIRCTTTAMAGSALSPRPTR